MAYRSNTLADLRRGPDSFNFMQFLGKFAAIVSWRPPPSSPRVGTSTSGKSWIRHCNDLITLPDSDFKPDGYTVLCRKYSLCEDSYLYSLIVQICGGSTWTNFGRTPPIPSFLNFHKVFRKFDQIIVLTPLWVGASLSEVLDPPLHSSEIH